MLLLFPAGAILIAVAFGWAVKTGRIPFSWVWLFVLGGVLGSTWEIGFTVTDMAYTVYPGGEPRPETESFEFDGPAIALLLILLIFCTWDAGIFMVGPLIARSVLRREIFTRFSWTELGIMLAWGQAQSFAVEMAAIAAGWWAYFPTRSNPELFPFLNGSITLWPQLVWVLAYLVFYAAGLRLAKPKAS